MFVSCFFMIAPSNSPMNGTDIGVYNSLPIYSCATTLHSIIKEVEFESSGNEEKPGFQITLDSP